MHCHRNGTAVACITSLLGALLSFIPLTMRLSGIELSMRSLHVDIVHQVIIHHVLAISKILAKGRP